MGTRALIAFLFGVIGGMVASALELSGWQWWLACVPFWVLAGVISAQLKQPRSV